MQIQIDRRELHKRAELGKTLPKTYAYLSSALEGLACQLISLGQDGLCAFFDFGRETAIAFRTDCDGLPIQERSDCGYASQHPGQMHACGHDGHMAILLELARRLNGKEALAHNVLLVFQPDEEGTGGARDICQSGIFETYHVQAIFGLHLWPELERGRIFSRKNELMARSCEVDIDIYGKSAHIAKAWEGIDALAAGVEFYRRAVEMEQALEPQLFRLLKFGRLESGSVRNALSAHTHMEGSLRAFQDPVFLGLQESLRRIGQEVEGEFGCRVEIRMNEGYPAVLNPAELYEQVRRCADFSELSQPLMTAEDFSFYQKRLPGLFFFLGIGPTPPLHADNFDFDDSVLCQGADFFEQIAEGFL